jgi:hypothetical protein
VPELRLVKRDTAFEDRLIKPSAGAVVKCRPTEYGATESCLAELDVAIEGCVAEPGFIVGNWSGLSGSG